MTSQDIAWNVTSIHKLPSSTPAATKYTNLTDSTQYARNNFNPSKRSFSRVPSAEENITALERILRQYWGHSHFRGPQKEICEAVTRGQDVVLVAPTGLGKSVCFQVPALAMEYGITLVISPLLALMKDQVRGLKEKGIKAEMLYEKSSSQDLAYTQLRMGHPELRLLYVTPETLFSAKISRDLRVAYDQKQLSRLVIDEAHVIEEWGMTFRGAYRDLGKFRQMYPDVPMTALTASATEDVRADILSTLGINKECLMQRVEPFNRRNLFYEIRYQGQLSPDNRITNLANFINGFKPEALKRNKRNNVESDTVTGLVYCRYRGVCDEVAEGLNSRNIKAMSFHAKLSDERRNQLLQMWQSGEVECIVATIAFGMGVDQPNVRYVVHYDMPKSFEGYYQETGRAGRDGHLSRCLLYYSREDAVTLRNLIEREANAAEAQRKRAEKGQAQSDLASGTENQDKARTRVMNSFKELQHYAEADRVCRHVAICRYFGEQIDASKESVLKLYCDKMCDVCSNPAAVRRRAFAVTQEIEIASQVIRPQRTTSHRLFVPVISQIDELSEGPSTPGDIPIVPTQQDHVPSSLRDLHGSDLRIPPNDRVHPVAGPSRAPTKEESVDMVMPSSTPPESHSGSADEALDDGFDVNDIDDLGVEGDVGFGPALFPSGDQEKAKSDSSDSLNHRETNLVPNRGNLRIASYGSSNHASQAGPSDYAQRDRQPLQDLANQTVKNVEALRTASKASAASGCEGDRRRGSSHRRSRHVKSPARAGPMMDQPNPETHRTPCPAPGHTRSKPRPVRTGPTALLNARRGTTVTTMDSLDAGNYAVPDVLPADPEHRQRQQDAFRAVTPITGRGPYSYYTNTAAPMTGRKRKLSATNETGSSFRTPFKVPTERPQEKIRVGLISAHRTTAIATIKEALRKSLVEGPEADRMWRHWGDKVGGRKASVKAAAVELESIIVRDCEMPDRLQQVSEDLAQAVRILRTREGAKIVTGGQLAEFERDEHGKWLVMVDRVIRQLD